MMFFCMRSQHLIASDFENILLDKINVSILFKVRNLQPTVRIHLDSLSGILQVSMDSCHTTLYDKLKYLQESI